MQGRQADEQEKIATVVASKVFLTRSDTRMARQPASGLAAPCKEERRERKGQSRRQARPLYTHAQKDMSTLTTTKFPTHALPFHETWALTSTATWRHSQGAAGSAAPCSSATGDGSCGVDSRFSLRRTSAAASPAVAIGGGEQTRESGKGSTQKRRCAKNVCGKGARLRLWSKWEQCFPRTRSSAKQKRRLASPPKDKDFKW